MDALNREWSLPNDTAQTAETGYAGHPHNADVTILGDYLHRRVKGRNDRCAPAPQRQPDPKRRLQGLLRPARNNQLLAALPASDYDRLRPALELVALPFGEVIYEAGCLASHAYFPLTGIVSMTQELASGAAAEVAIAGGEGMVGVALFMGGEVTTGRAFVRAAGVGYRVGANVLTTEFDRCRPLRQMLLRYAQALITQMAHTAVCRGHHSVEEQVCRFLLSTLDRSPADDLALTQELIAQLLGVRRESVTAAAGALQAADAIRYRRGRITVLDRYALEDRACECYSAIRGAGATLRLGAHEDAGPRRPVRVAQHAWRDCTIGARL